MCVELLYSSGANNDNWSHLLYARRQSLAFQCRHRWGINAQTADREKKQHCPTDWTCFRTSTTNRKLLGSTNVGKHGGNTPTNCYTLLLCAENENQTIPRYGKKKTRIFLRSVHYERRKKKYLLRDQTISEKANYISKLSNLSGSIFTIPVTLQMPPFLPSRHIGTVCLLLGIEEGIAPHSLHHLLLLNTHLLCVDLGKSLLIYQAGVDPRSSNDPCLKKNARFWGTKSSNPFGPTAGWNFWSPDTNHIVIFAKKTKKEKVLAFQLR